jgi:phage tail-like protein
MPSSPSPYSAHNFVLYLENFEGDQEPLGGFEETSGLPARPPGCHKVHLALRRGVCNARSLWDWIQAERGKSGTRWRNAILTQGNAAETSMKSWRLRSATPKKYKGPTPECVAGDVAIEELVLSVEYVEVRVRP